MKRLILSILVCLPMILMAAPFINLETVVVQPDGSTLDLLASGDEFANRLHDEDGYSIIQSTRDGFYYYAILEDGEPVASQHRVGQADPASLGLTPGINISNEKYNQRRAAMTAHNRSDGRAPNTGTVNNINIFIRFSDQTEFEESRENYDNRFNAVGDEAYSLRNYFHKVSYNQLNYVTHHYPVCEPSINLSYQDSHPRAYYMPYNAITNPLGYQDYERTDREHTLLANAINFIANQVPASVNIDADNDGAVDNVCFIIRGTHTAWAELLWAHRWALYTQEVYINNKQVWDFTFQPENQNSVRTLCHEMFHSVGAPDLYHYQFNGITPAGCWDIMESGTGHMGMYMKWKYGGWIDDIPLITPGTYTLDPVSSQYNSVYRIPLTANEYLVVEYRKQGSDIFEEGLPGSGMLIYRINSDMDGNASGPPDEVYVFRPEGTYTVNGLIADAAFNDTFLRTEFNAYTDPACHQTGGSPATVNISQIALLGDELVFTLNSNSSPYPPIVEDVYPTEALVLSPGQVVLSADATAYSGTIQSVSFTLNGVQVGCDTSRPYSFPVEISTPGLYELKVMASASTGLTAGKLVRFRVVDPQINTWFSWMSETPSFDSYGRGAVPIKAAIDLDLGNQNYVVKKLAFNLVDDSWGDAANPGQIGVTINRFSGGEISNQILLDLGFLQHSLNGRQEYIINSSVELSGQIAVILDLGQYQKMAFDTSGQTGHSWLTEPNRIWTDALGRGMLGAAAIELQLQAPGVGISDEVNTPAIAKLAVYPNPFTNVAQIEMELNKDSIVRLSVYNIRGQLVRELLPSETAMTAGKHSIGWNGQDSAGNSTSSGVYFYRFELDGKAYNGKMLYIN